MLSLCLWNSIGWVRINGTDSSALIRATLMTELMTLNCIGTVLAKQGCWSFLKGGFVLTSPSNLSVLYFQYENELIDLLLQHSDDTEINIAVTSASLQPFSEQQWRFNQQYSINTVSTTTTYICKKAVIKYKLTLVQKRKRAVTIHVSDRQGGRLQGAAVTVEQVSRDFPFGSAIAKTILGNLPYQNWFVKRFNAAVFENELKWYATEPKPGQINYTFADQMLEFVRANQISARGHNIFWEDPKYTPAWVQNLTGSTLQAAINSRIKSLMSRYKEEFIHWDVSNEMLHFDFYEQRLGHNATLHFYEMAHQFDPLATLFMNEFNVVETCTDANSTVDAYISRMRELKQGGVSMDGIGLEGHFSVPNLPLMRAILDKLATLGLPIWLTEVDISNKLNEETQAIYLEEVLREGFSHPSVDGIMLWTALHPYGCYQMCLTDNDFHNLPAGNTVDKLLNEWQTGTIEDQTDEQGSYSFYGFLGEYKVYVETNSTKKIGCQWSSFRVAAVDAWKHSDFLCKNYILNGLDNALYNVYSPMVNAKALWESLERKYKTEDAGSKKFVVGKFLDFKMMDSKTVISQVQEFQLILHDIHAEGMVLGESFQVAALIEKLPPTWKDFKNYLKHKRKEMKLEDLIVRLRIEEDNRQSEKKAGNYHQEAKANVVEQASAYGSLSLSLPLSAYPVLPLPNKRQCAMCFDRIFICISVFCAADEPLYDYSAYTECKRHAEKPLYDGGVLKDLAQDIHWIVRDKQNNVSSPAFVLKNLAQASIYSFSSWIKINGTASALIRASLRTEDTTLNCIGTVMAKQGCWSFLKGGFVLNSPSNFSVLYFQLFHMFQHSDDRDVNIAVTSASLQPFTKQQWRFNHQYKINSGERLQGAAIMLEQVSKGFPFGSAIASTIIGNVPYQLSGYTCTGSGYARTVAPVRQLGSSNSGQTHLLRAEPKPGQINYTIADQMLEFVRANQIIARGQNIFWENPNYNPTWVQNLTGSALQSAVNSRIHSLIIKYREDFIHWDVSNEMLHFDFYEQRLGPNATHLHFKIKDLKQGGASMDGIGLEGHFTVPNLPLMRAILDKLATLKLPIWLTEIDISNKLDAETQAIYLEQVLREGFSHPSVNGMMLWTALHRYGCYQMCLTDNDLKNLPAGDTVDKLLNEWQTGFIADQSDELGSYSFFGFLGEYNVTAKYDDDDDGLLYDYSAYTENSDGKEMNITVASTSLQPFTYQQWRTSQQYKINNERKRAITIHVSDVHGDGMQGAEITVEQVSRDFPFGSAIAKTILANPPYQSWFLERFNAAVFENELKWYSTEPRPGQVNYTIPDQMLEFVRANQITARGHNIFWENPAYTPAWVRNLTSPELKLAVNSRIQSLMSKYKSEFIHWDVSNEMLHYDFYEQRLGPNVTLQLFETAHQSDPLATLFMNDFNVVETCNDVNSTVDAYISRLRELERGGVSTAGIGLEGHFTIPNPPLIRAVLDKLATLQLPIWLTEVDISNTLDKETQGTYLEVVLREGFSHPAVNGIMLWTALHPYGCYEMCLTDNNLRNLPAGDVVDKLLKEWHTGVVGGQTDDHGSFSFDGFLGEYKVTVSYANKTANSTFALCQGDETRHFSIQL
ncbi:hypothetical protein RJ639_037857 [Escallonia herrerae]|uniref:GH10 domain-containing protein n=2 Tax=Escallonia herrerae TaxID=1293975 RepID=A0AA88WJD0_9ASTE|nr:hypothetical protein RJ639_037857 [Escallonia herrerae]